MTLRTQFQAAFRSALAIDSDDITYTSSALPADPAICRGTVERLGPDDERYKDRVGTRYEVSILAADLVSEAAGTTLIPEKLDQIRVNGQTLKVAPNVGSISREWGLYRLLCEETGRPVPR